MFDRRKFNAQLALKDMTIKKLAEILGIDESTLYRKIRNDGSFTREEMNTMIEVLSIDNPTDIFFATELA